MNRRPVGSLGLETRKDGMWGWEAWSAGWEEAGRSFLLLLFSW